MPPTPDALAPTSTQATILSNLLGYLTTRGFPVTNWSSGSVGDTLTQVWSQAVADLAGTLVNLAASGFLPTAVGGWLDLLALGAYQATRNPAVLAVGTFQLACAGASGPYAVAVGQLWVADAFGRRFNNTTGGTLLSGTTLLLTFQAESPGAAWNVGVGAALALQTPLAGVTVTPYNLGGNTWLTQPGADAETDAALALRCTLKWSALAGLGGQGGATTAAIAFWAKQATPSATFANPVTRVLVSSGTPPAPGPYGPGTAAVILACDAGAFPGGDTDPSVVAANTAVQAIVPVTAQVQVRSAAALAVVVAGTVYYQSALLSEAAARAQVEANLKALLAAVPINGTVYYSRLVEAILLPLAGTQNIRNVVGLLANGTLSDIALGPVPTYQVPSLTVPTALAFVGV